MSWPPIFSARPTRSPPGSGTCRHCAREGLRPVSHPSRATTSSPRPWPTSVPLFRPSPCPFPRETPRKYSPISGAGKSSWSSLDELPLIPETGPDVPHPWRGSSRAGGRTFPSVGTAGAGLLCGGPPRRHSSGLRVTAPWEPMWTNFSSGTGSGSAARWKLTKSRWRSISPSGA